MCRFVMILIVANLYVILHGIQIATMCGKICILMIRIHVSSCYEHVMLHMYTWLKHNVTYWYECQIVYMDT
jgi:hypothetical protein